MKNYQVFYGKAVYDEQEIAAVVDCLTAGILCDGPLTARFEVQIATLFQKRHGLFVNSASAALDLIFQALELPEGSEVITPACTFATSFGAIVKNKLMPRLVDVEIGSYVASVQAIADAINENTRAVLLPLLIGSIPELKAIQTLCQNAGILLIEDSADQLGGLYNGQPTGAYTDVSITSFYASHHITAGGVGGMLCVNDAELLDKLKTLRDWGRRYIHDDAPDRFQMLAGIEYDQKFTHHELGGNARASELSAAFGLCQLSKLNVFNAIRHRNFTELYNYFSTYAHLFHLPTTRPEAEVTWHSFPLTLKHETLFSRAELVKHFESKGIQTRPLFAGNLLKHPFLENIPVRHGPLPQSDTIFRQAFLLGCHHGMDASMIIYLRETFDAFYASRVASSV